MEKKDMIYGIVILFDLIKGLIPLAIFIIITVLIVKEVRKNLKIKEYNAETERIKAEAMRDAAAQKKNENNEKN